MKLGLTMLPLDWVDLLLELCFTSCAVCVARDARGWEAFAHLSNHGSHTKLSLANICTPVWCPSAGMLSANVHLPLFTASGQKDRRAGTYKFTETSGSNLLPPLVHPDRVDSNSVVVMRTACGMLAESSGEHPGTYRGEG